MFWITTKQRFWEFSQTNNEMKTHIINQANELKEQGLSLSEIAEKLNISKTSAHRITTPKLALISPIIQENDLKVEKNVPNGTKRNDLELEKNVPNETKKNDLELKKNNFKFPVYKELPKKPIETEKTFEGNLVTVIGTLIIKELIKKK